MRDLLLAEETRCPLHLSGISTARSVEMVAMAKARGVPVSCDVSPYHLVLTDEDMGTYDPARKLLPPLRPASDRQALIKGLASGVIDCVASNHTPWTAEEHDVEFAQAPWGAIALETTLPLLYTHLVLPGHLSLLQLVRCLSTRSAELLHLLAGEGTLRPGAVADLTLIDPQQERSVVLREQLSRGRNVPIEGVRLQGWPVATYVGGSQVWSML